MAEPTQLLRGYLRAIAGGLIVGTPLLYTQEVWWLAATTPAWKILVLLAVSALVVLGYNAVTGFRRDATRLEVLVDSIEALGIGVVVATIALVVLGRIDSSTSLRVAAGMVALESIPIAFGASLASAQLGGPEGSSDTSSANGFGPFERLLLAGGGALLFALSVAPTEEPVLIGILASPWLLLGMVLASLVVTGALVPLAEFAGRRHSPTSLIDRPVTETITAYAISLGIALLLAWAFGRTEGASPVAIVGVTVSLALVASLGAAVGRLLVTAPAQEE
jgi:putative integral membrane protein (TIGR02587 family)